MKKGLAILFSLLIFLSNTNITIAKHFCGGSMVSSELVFGTEHPDCGMESAKSECNTESEEATIENSCCDNEVLSMGGDVSFDNLIQDYQIDTHFFLSYIQSYIQLFSSELNLNKPSVFIHLKLPSQQLYSLFQVFLI